MDDATELRSFLSKDLFDWLQGGDALDACDALLLRASDVFENLPTDHTPSWPAPPVPRPPSPTPGRASCSSRPFAREEEIEQARLKGVPLKTQQDTGYCVRLWNACHQAAASVTIPPLPDLDSTQLQRWLTSFILEVRKKDGSEFPPNTLHHLICGLVRYIRLHGKPQLDVFKDPDFSGFRSSLDAEMKRLQTLGIGSKRRQAEIFTEEDEEMLWQQGLLGDSSPQSLLDTIIFMCGLYFALRSGQEHRQLRFKPYQIELFQPTGGRPYLQYTEDIRIGQDV